MKQLGYEAFRTQTTIVRTLGMAAFLALTPAPQAFGMGGPLLNAMAQTGAAAQAPGTASETAAAAPAAPAATGASTPAAPATPAAASPAPSGPAAPAASAAPGLAPMYTGTSWQAARDAEPAWQGNAQYGDGNQLRLNTAAYRDPNMGRYIHEYGEWGQQTRQGNITTLTNASFKIPQGIDAQGNPIYAQNGQAYVMSATIPRLQVDSRTGMVLHEGTWYRNLTDLFHPESGPLGQHVPSQYQAGLRGMFQAPAPATVAAAAPATVAAQTPEAKTAARVFEQGSNDASLYGLQPGGDAGQVTREIPVPGTAQEAERALAAAPRETREQFLAPLGALTQPMLDLRDRAIAAAQPRFERAVNFLQTQGAAAYEAARKEQERVRQAQQRQALQAGPAAAREVIAGGGSGEEAAAASAAATQRALADLAARRAETGAQNYRLQTQNDDLVAARNGVTNPAAVTGPDATLFDTVRADHRLANASVLADYQRRQQAGSAFTGWDDVNRALPKGSAGRMKDHYQNKHAAAFVQQTWDWLERNAYHGTDADRMAAEVEGEIHRLRNLNYQQATRDSSAAAQRLQKQIEKAEAELAQWEGYTHGKRDWNWYFYDQDEYYQARQEKIDALGELYDQRFKRWGDTYTAGDRIEILEDYLRRMGRELPQ